MNTADKWILGLLLTAVILYMVNTSINVDKALANYNCQPIQLETDTGYIITCTE